MSRGIDPTMGQRYEIRIQGVLADRWLLDRLWIVYPGDVSYELDAKVTAIPLASVSGIRHAGPGRAGP